MEISQWLEKSHEQPVELSSRIRLARNFEHMPFPALMDSSTDLLDIVKTLESSLAQFRTYYMDDLSVEEKHLLVEKHLISPMFIERGLAVIVNDEASVAIMVNEEDHLRIQAMGVKETLNEIYEVAVEIDELLEDKFHYAFSPQYGFLTACPSNVGTGLRASVMLHLPALTMTNRLKGIHQQLSRFGFTLRGSYGESSSAIGHVYQLSNQMTLGQTEEDIINHLEELKVTLITEELNARKQFNDAYPIATKDTVYRAYGMLKYAYTLSLKEAANALSHIKVGIDLGIINIENFKFQAWLEEIQPAFIKMHIKENISTMDMLKTKIDQTRASLMREKLGG